MASRSSAFAVTYKARGVGILTIAASSLVSNQFQTLMPSSNSTSSSQHVASSITAPRYERLTRMSLSVVQPQQADPLPASSPRSPFTDLLIYSTRLCHSVDGTAPAKILHSELHVQYQLFIHSCVYVLHQPARVTEQS